MSTAGRSVGSRAVHPIGIFDSGFGGLSILRALRAALPDEDFVYLADSGHAPYGERGDVYVIERTHAIVEQLCQQHGIKALVIACNTATAAAIDLVRSAHPGLPVVGVEPALKPALALTVTRRIGVMATRVTLASAKLQALHASLEGQAEFIFQPCDGLADAIQQQNAAEIAAFCRRYTEAIGHFGSQSGQVDTLVLGCTHYAFAHEELAALVGPDVAIIETGEPVARQTRRLLREADLLNPKGAGRIELLTTGALEPLQAAGERWLNLSRPSQLL